MSIQATIFDFGGVLIRWNPARVFEPFFAGRPEALEEFMDEVRFSEWNAEQDRGRPFQEGVRIHSETFPHYAALFDSFRRNWADSIEGPLEGSIELLERFKRNGRRIYGLSNWSAETFPLVRRRHAFFDLFDGIIISGEVGLIKPDPAIFKLALRSIGRPAAECLFIDDSLPNIRTAEGLGMHAIHFTSPEHLKEELAAFGLP